MCVAACKCNRFCVQIFIVVDEPDMVMHVLPTEEQCTIAHTTFSSYESPDPDTPALSVLAARTREEKPYTCPQKACVEEACLGTVHLASRRLAPRRLARWGRGSLTRSTTFLFCRG